MMNLPHHASHRPIRTATIPALAGKGGGVMNGPTVLIIALFLLNIGLSIKNELDLREIERARRKRASLRPSERME